MLTYSQEVMDKMYEKREVQLNLSANLFSLIASSIILNIFNFERGWRPTRRSAVSSGP